ncbi:MAG: PDZ domain-containing protein [Thermoanaerobaculia bacterium]
MEIEPPGRFAKLWQVYWKAGTAHQAQRASRKLVESGIGFDEAHAGLARGRPYGGKVRRGLSRKARVGRGGLQHLYAVVVPEDYSSETSYPVTFYLHGGVLRPAPSRSDTWWPGALVDSATSEIVVIPAGWSESLWWQAHQVENLANILDRLKRTYNIDENRVSLMGVSDGGTGAYFQAFRATTQWASFLSFIGHSRVLGSDSINADGDMFAVNLSNKPWFVVNTGNDRLYPSYVVVPYLELFESVGTEIVFRHQPDFGHDLRWWPNEEDRINRFIENHPRNPLPDRIVWETERVDRYNRAHWVVIDELGPVPGESDLPGLNSISVIPRGPSLGISPDPQSTTGIVVNAVQTGSLAARAGVEPGDVIMAVAGAPTPNLSRLAEEVSKMAAWESAIPLSLERAGESLEIVVYTPPAPPAQPPIQAFPRSGQSGRVEVSRKGNKITVRSAGVRTFRLLLSPDQFDFDRQLQVDTNGVTSFRGTIAPSVGTLFKWAAIDNDRTMLFGAELEVQVAVGKGSLVGP